MIAIQKTLKKVHDTVRCGYLHLSHEPLLTPQGTQALILMECRNLACTHGSGCNFYDKGECQYRSLKTKSELLYRPGI